MNFIFHFEKKKIKKNLCRISGCSTEERGRKKAGEAVMNFPIKPL